VVQASPGHAVMTKDVAQHALCAAGIDSEGIGETGLLCLETGHQQVGKAMVWWQLATQCCFVHVEDVLDIVLVGNLADLSLCSFDAGLEDGACFTMSMEIMQSHVVLEGLKPAI
jgi:hypothetical protein